MGIKKNGATGQGTYIHVHEIQYALTVCDCTQGEWEGDVDSELQTPGLLSPFTLSQESNLSPGVLTQYVQYIMAVD